MILLDTHVWYRWSVEHPKLQREHEEAIGAAFASGESVRIAAISCWEVGMLVSKNRLPLPLPLGDWIDASLAPLGVTVIPLDRHIATAASCLPGDIHGDPADRIIAATARVLDARLLTADRKLLAYPHVKTL